MESCTWFILILLGLCFKASSGANSTLAYYVEVQLEVGAYDNFTKLIENLVLDSDHTTVVKDINITTECRTQGSAQVNCTCNLGYTWSDEVCKNYTECCDENSCLFAAKNPLAMCLSEKRVLISGTFRVAEPFTSNLARPESPEYKKFVNNYTEQLENVYSTLSWFDSLKINELKQGSVIGLFQMLLTDQFKSSDLENAVNKLYNSTNATFNLIVTGLVDITRNPESQEPIPYEGNTSITCTTTENLGKPLWFFQQQQQQEVTNGTEANVTYSPLQSTVSINRSTEVWKGTFTCDYLKSASIIYRASLYLDIALLPPIIIISDPQFPSCIGQTRHFFISVLCIVPNNTEIYNVSWEGNSPESNTEAPPGKYRSYKTQKEIFCDENPDKYTVTCTFRNRLNQTTNASLDIPIITKSSTYCSEDNGWQMAKSNFTAIMLCNSNAVGLKKRNCTNSIWGDVISLCVNEDLFNLLSVTKNLQRGLGIVEKNAYDIFQRLRTSTNNQNINSFANVNASVYVLESIYSASNIQNSGWNGTVLPDFVKSSSNLLNDSLHDSWTPVNNDTDNLAFKYLETLEGIIHKTNLNAASITSALQQENIELIVYNKSNKQLKGSLKNVNVSVIEISSNVTVQTAIYNLASKLPNTLYNEETYVSDTILSVVGENNTRLSMVLKLNRLPNHQMYCVYWDSVHHWWSDKGCRWGGVNNPDHCDCDHLTSFAIMMAKEPINLQYMEELTYAGLGFSIVSLILGLVIEFLVWNTVVKSNIAHFRHTVLVNIMVCLSIADSSFLAAPVPSSSPSNWCLSLTVLKHFCYLAVFFWMLCLSLGLLHQVIFVFVPLRKNVYLGLCFFLGYVCPLIIVIVTIITYDNAMAGQYYSTETCWLIYVSALKGSIHAFLFPVFVIVFLNMFTMVVVISRILKPTLSEGSTHDEKEIARSIIKTVVLLTPTLGITWILGLFVLVLDLTLEPYAQIVNYAFTFFNSFQGFFILLTGCFGEKRVRDALHKRFRAQQSAYSNNESSTRNSSTNKIK
ncbi:adhesion G-protein coupled receptor F3-like [Hoplias malabaricus]|uniref:adhesion G-protein coupled receptor F3-like n=1 Tax=Hoplias malabaricus TaxID=27720 RepID=UPI003462057C